MVPISGAKMGGGGNIPTVVVVLLISDGVRNRVSSFDAGRSHCPDRGTER